MVNQSVMNKTTNNFLLDFQLVRCQRIWNVTIHFKKIKTHNFKKYKMSNIYLSWFKANFSGLFWGIITFHNLLLFSLTIKVVNNHISIIIMCLKSYTICFLIPTKINNSNSLLFSFTKMCLWCDCVLEYPSPSMITYWVFFPWNFALKVCRLPW